MYTYKIKPPTLIEQVVSYPQRRLGHIIQTPSTNLPMDKVAYSRWIETVRQEFKVNDLVTLNHIAVVPGNVPFHYRVAYINELFSTVSYDLDVKEYRCIACETLDKVYIDKCPAVLRKLTPEELRCVNLSNPGK